jgi:tetratricopeptide (TPR) repeat protein
LLLWGQKHFIFGAHLTNILLHCGTGVLFYLFLRSFKWNSCALTPAWAGMAALIFTLHPQRVESVVWLSERKDCLAMFLGLAALLLFWRALQKEKVSWAGAVCFLLSLLAKPMWLFFVVPAAALIWMERRSFQWKLYLKLLFPALLFSALYAAFLAWSIFSGPGGTAAPLTPAALLLKAETIFYNYGNYFLRTFLPGNIYPLYPYYDPAIHPRWMALAGAALLLIPFLARKKELQSGLFFGVLPVVICFIVCLVPVAGFLRVGNTDFADRYSYLPSLFLVAGSAFLLKLNLPKESAFGSWLPVLGLLYCGGFLYQTERYIPVWRDDVTVTERSVSLPFPNYNAAIARAIQHYSKGEFDKALIITQQKFTPKDEKSNPLVQIFKLSLQGLILFDQGKGAEGIKYLNSIYMSPHSGWLSDLPIDYAQKVLTVGANYHLKTFNDKKAAANLYMRCSVLFRDHAQIYEAFYAGMAALLEENYPEAVKQFRLAHQLNPQEKRCLQNLRYAENKLKEKLKK